MRGETDYDEAAGTLRIISIHSPHAGRDGAVIGLTEVKRISIHSPLAGRDAIAGKDILLGV